MPNFSVRSVIHWAPRADQEKTHLYEERITLWIAQSLEDAIDMAEQEAEAYAGGDGERLGLLQGFWLYDEFTLPAQGVEVFSLLRESDFEPRQYLDAFFATGCERERDYIAEPNSSRNGGPAPSVDNPNAPGGPPSVS
jgi:hypothetical protein